MTSKRKIGTLALLASVSMAAQAGNFSYNYGQIGYELGDFEGLTLAGSFEINADVFVLVRFADLTEDVGGIDLDYNEFSIGAGYHMPVNPMTDAVFTGSFVSAEAEVAAINFLNVVVPGYKVDDDGILLCAGVRHNLNPNFELAGHIFHTTVFDSDTGFFAEARYLFDSKMSAGLSFTSSDVIDGPGINFRVGF